MFAPDSRVLGSGKATGLPHLRDEFVVGVLLSIYSVDLACLPGINDSTVGIQSPADVALQCCLDPKLQQEGGNRDQTTPLSGGER